MMMALHAVPMSDSPFASSPDLSEWAESARSSLQHLPRHTTSRTRLVHTQARHANDAPTISSPNDIPSSPVVRSPLQTIPGSRPNSPGRALDLGMHAVPAEPNRGRRISRASLDITAREDFPPSIDESRVPPRFRRDSLPSQPSSPVVDESFIHPLFRSDSPLPPPTPTMITTVTASAFGGQAMSRDDFTRARSSTRPAAAEGHLAAGYRPRTRGASVPDGSRPASASTAARQDVAGTHIDLDSS